MGQLKYKSNTTSQEWLRNNGFFYSKGFSEDDDIVYVHKFPVYRWGLIATLEGEMRLHIQTGMVTVDVYDVAGLTRGVYAPFYYQADGIHDGFVKQIVENIEKECRRLGFVEWGD